MTTKEAVALLERYSNYDGMGIPNLAGCKEAMRVAVDALKEACPELRESDDEKIIKTLQEYVKNRNWALNGPTQDEVLAWLEKQKDASKAIEAVDRIDKYIDENVANAHDMKDSNPDKQYYRGWDDALGKMAGILIDVYSNDKQKGRKPILEVFGFKVGDAVRLKDGDGRKHIIKSFEEVEGLHGSNFYRVEFEDNSARDGIYPGEEYPNGYYTQMEKFEEEQKPAEWSEEDEKQIAQIERIVKNAGCSRMLQEKIHNWLESLRPQPKVDWGGEDEKWFDYFERLLEFGYNKDPHHLGKLCIDGKMWLKSLRPLPHWKPSEEQMKALEDAFRKNGSDEYRKIINSLYQDLKKL